MKEAIFFWSQTETSTHYACSIRICHIMHDMVDECDVVFWGCLYNSSCSSVGRLVDGYVSRHIAGKSYRQMVHWLMNYSVTWSMEGSGAQLMRSPFFWSVDYQGSAMTLFNGKHALQNLHELISALQTQTPSTVQGSNIRSKVVTFDGVRVLLYEPIDRKGQTSVAGLVYFHGGGYVLGSPG